MTSVFRYLTHPQVQIDPDVPVPKWGLSDIGRERTKAIVYSAVWSATNLIVSSAETKAVETAAIIAAPLSIQTISIEEMHENDRSSTGFLKSDDFEVMADAFFANPETGVKGWERAIDAQSRIVGEAEKILKDHEEGDILFVGHGAVGTLLYCHYAALPINREYDQPAGGGNYFAAEIESRKILHGWKNMDTFL